MKTNNLRMTGKIILICSCLLLMLLFTQCRGPRGNDGLDGINYTHSAIYDISASDWAGDLNGYDFTISVPEITEDIYNNGAVLVYRLIEIAPKSFNMLPYTYVDNASTVYLDFDAYVGNIDLMYKEVTNGVNSTAAPGAMSFKVVIIEGIPLATLKGMVDISDYRSVAKLLNIDRSINTVK